MSEKKRTIAHERAVKAYLTPLNHNRVMKFVEQKGLGKSEAINEIVSIFFREQQQRQRASNNLY